MSKIEVGDTVRIKDSYPEFIHATDDLPEYENKPGVEFLVTRVVPHDVSYGDWQETFYVSGDPNGWDIWGSQVEKVEDAA